jgi:aldose 1-epimerase
MKQPYYPSGAQYPIHWHGHEAIVVEVGAGLRTYTVDGRSVISGYEPNEMCPSARGAALIPWPNRLEDGHYEFGGRAQQLPLTEPSRHNAIHGLTRWENWAALQREPHRVLLGLTLYPREGYPFGLELRIEYRLGEAGLAVTTTARNIGDSALPYGAGQHPYLTVGTELVDTAWLRIPARSRVETDERQNATGRRLPVDGTEYDFRGGRPIQRTVLDTAFADLEPDTDGVTSVELRNPQDGFTLRLWMDRAYPYVMAFTGDTLPEPGRRRRSLGLEPMTCAPNAFRLSGLGLKTLQPGEGFHSTWGISL